ncbi:ABC transporter ATP-binding protein [Paracoccus sp. p4-l81]|uniref:ABC transporter ATP-binding protein n=1 Tax=unclassified Paracoccus (in: a-proteobacteria) TaxID=2688777 RepID=UPI0035B6ED68
MLKIDGATAVLGAHRVLDGFSARVRQGRLTALVGPNGCGKSTLLRAVMGFVPLSAGAIRLDDQPIRGLPRPALARRVAYLPQDSHCPDHLSVGELVELGGYARCGLFGGPDAADRARFRAALTTVGLSDLAHRPVNALSGGQRQRAWIALVLAQDAPLMLLDEPVNHLDMRYQYDVLALVRDLTLHHGRTVVCVLHDMNLASGFADDLVMMKDGRAEVAGPVEATLTATNVARVFGFDAEILRHNGRTLCLPQLADRGPANHRPQGAARA